MQNSYMFKLSSLVKKTTVVTISKMKYHLIFYFCLNHVNSLNSSSTNVSVMGFQSQVLLFAVVWKKKHNHDNYNLSTTYQNHILSNNNSSNHSQSQTNLLSYHSSLSNNHFVSDLYIELYNFLKNTSQICEEKDDYCVNIYI